MKQAILLISVFVTSWSVCPAQGSRLAPSSFEDSVRTVLQNARNTDATSVGTSFFSLWTQLEISQQMLIKKQALLMRKQKFGVRNHLVNYFGAIVDAVNIEQAGPAVLTEYLKVAGKVIEQADAKKAQLFFAGARTFFQHHALHYERDYRLYARDDDYTFEYLEPAPPPTLSWNDPPPSDTGAEPPVEDLPPATDDPPGPSLWEEPAAEPAETNTDFLPSYILPSPPPVFEGPVIRFKRLTLNFVTPYDSVSLTNSAGSYSLYQNIFSGEGGTFEWTPAGLTPDSLICNMTTYHFNVKKPELSTEVVKLNYLGKTPGFIAGSFEFRSPPRRDSTLSTYPRFRSYQSDLVINGLADENVHYRGGFSLIGNRVSSASATGEPAVIEVYNRGQKRFTATSGEFVFSPGTIVANKAKVNIQQGNDSLVHQMVRLKYEYGPDSTQTLLLQKDDGDMRNAPYSSTFFNIDFSADKLRWDLYSDSLNVQTDAARNTVPLVIESIDYYDPEDYRLLKGIGFTFHPLALVANYVLKNGVSEFYSGDLAMDSRQNPMEIKQAMDFLRQKGFVTYDSRTDRVQVKAKAIDLYLAFKGEEDYDNLKIHSVTDQHPNATINFEKRNMTVRGVEEFDLSDSLNVHIVPDSSVITILQNRDIQFDGTVSAGNFEISGKGFTLKYDSFFISLTHIDSINFYVTETNARGQQIRRKVNNSMVSADSATAAAGGLGGAGSSSGTLFISRANNKSGKENIPGYPRLDATSGGVIYFDREEVLGGVYDRSMFFVVPPFKIDSLNDADPLSIKFDGTFVSSGMFPSIKETLHTMPDKSLGFEHEIPPPGYQLYNGDGNMNGIIVMNNRGLRGTGRIDLLAAKVASKEFVFYPDSVIARGNRATIDEKQFGSVLFPQASLPDFQMKWLPKEDRMQLKNLKAPFNFYDSTAQMLGTITISRKGVAGAGKLETRGTELISRYMNFNGKDFGARHARFKVKSDDPSKNLLAGDDIRLKFDLDENYADISPEIEGTAAIEFPYAQFKTSIPRARWDLKARKITMSKADDVPIENSYFYTTRKELDSLHFNAARAEYDLQKQELKVSGIPYIVVADAMITPENNEVLIHENARIGTLHNTTILLDTLNGYHRLTEGVVDIISRKEFSGHATYQYVNFLQDTFAIKMTNFHLEPISAEEETRRAQRRHSQASMQTVAKGSVTEQDMLVLGAGMYYKGDLTMYATRPALQLDGYIKLDIKNIKDYNTWIEYSQTGDETEVVLNFNNAIDEDGRKLSAGLHFSGADNNLYLTFASNKKSDDDDDLFTPSGQLYYDTLTKEYKIEDPDKAAGAKLSGKVFAYNDETRGVRFEGPVNLYNGTKNFNITSTALGTASFETGEVQMNSFLIMDTDIPPTAFDLLARDLQEVIKNEGAEEGLGDQTELLYKIADIAGERATKDFEARSVQGYVSLATVPELARPLVFSNVTLKWSPEMKAFYSDGNIGISNSGKNDINGAFEGFMEIRKSEDGVPVFHVFFKASPESWYYFGIEDNRLLVYSSNKAFNDIISKKSTAGKAKIGEVAFIPGSEEETLMFINRFRKQYLDIDAPYSLYENTAPAESIPPGFQTAPPPDSKPVEELKNDGFGPVQQQPKKDEFEPPANKNEGFGPPADQKNEGFGPEPKKKKDRSEPAKDKQDDGFGTTQPSPDRGVSQQPQQQTKPVEPEKKEPAQKEKDDGF